MTEKMQKRIVYLFVGIAVLYFSAFSIFSMDETKLAQLPQNKFYNDTGGFAGEKIIDQEVYEATYQYVSKNGTRQTLTARIYPQSEALPENYYGTIEERAAKEIQSAAVSANIPLTDDYKKEIHIAHLYTKG